MAPARYGQHFLVDKTAIQSILEALGPQKSDSILEIGPGRGALTKELVQTEATLTAIEVDSKMVDSLRGSIGAAENFTLLNSDILKFDLGQLPSSESPDHLYKVVGNLPYNLTSPILRRLSEWSAWRLGIVMVQKEVGDRLCAEIGTKEYSALTVGMNLTCEMSRVFDLPEDSFRPPPKVKSTVVKLLKRPKPLTDRIEATQKVIQASFQQRRKTLLNSLSHGLSMSKDQIKDLLEKSDIDPMLRPERLSVEKFIEITNRIKK